MLVNHRKISIPTTSTRHEMCLAHYWAIPRSDSDFSGRSLFAKAARGERSEGGCLVPRLCQAHAWRHLWISLSFSLLPFSVALYNALFSPRPDRAHLFCARLHRCFGRQPCTRATLLDFDFWFSHGIFWIFIGGKEMLDETRISERSGFCGEWHVLCASCGAKRNPIDSSSAWESKRFTSMK